MNRHDHDPAARDRERDAIEGGEAVAMMPPLGRAEMILYSLEVARRLAAGSPCELCPVTATHVRPLVIRAPHLIRRITDKHDAEVAGYLTLTLTCDRHWLATSTTLARLLVAIREAAEREDAEREDAT